MFVSISMSLISGPKSCFNYYRKLIFLFITTVNLSGPEIQFAETQQALKIFNKNMNVLHYLERFNYWGRLLNYSNMMAKL